MKLCYQVATPDIELSPDVTAYQGELEKSLGILASLGYDGVEFMTLAPERLDIGHIKALLTKHGLVVPLVCTGEIFGQLKVSFTDTRESAREEAVRRVKAIVDFAAELGANVNIGRVRGQIQPRIPQAQSYDRAVAALREVCVYAAAKSVQIAIETVCIMQTNFINTLEEAVALIRDVGCDNLKIMMDIFHLNLEERDIIGSIYKYAPYNIHVHFADNNRRYPGSCALDFRKIIHAFRDVGYNGAFCTEIFQIPDQDTAAKGAIEYLAPIFESIYGWQRNKASGN